MTEENDRNVGIQPLDAIMAERDIKNHDLVAAVAPGTLTHKQVQKARKGRRLTTNMQDKILDAMNAYAKPEEYAFRDLFNYRGKKTL
jgi:DNA-binding Xre family transcriptional regulator